MDFPCRYPGLPLLAVFAGEILTVTVTVYCVLREAEGLVEVETEGLCKVYPPFEYPSTALRVSPVRMFWQFEPETLEDVMVNDDEVDEQLPFVQIPFVPTNGALMEAQFCVVGVTLHV